MVVYNNTPVITFGLQSSHHPVICPQKWDHPCIKLSKG